MDGQKILTLGLIKLHLTASALRSGGFGTPQLQYSTTVQ